MKICVLSPRSQMPEMVPLVAITDPAKRRYCKRHGYEFLTPTLPGNRCNEEEKYGFKRLVLLVDLLKSNAYDWIWVVGCDVLITNPSIKLESLIDDNFGLVIGTEPGGVGMDSFLIRRARGGLELMERLLAYRDHPVGGAHEQSTLDSIRSESEVAKVIKVLPQRALNSYKYSTLHQYAFLHPGFVTGTDALGNSGEWQPGDFVLHTPGLPKEDQKIKIFSEVIPLIDEFPVTTEWIERLMRFYRSTRSNGDIGGIWQGITSAHHRSLVDAIQGGDSTTVIAALNNLATSGALAGIEALAPIPRSLFDNLVQRLAQRMGIIPIANPEQPSPSINWSLQNADLALSRCSELLGIPMSLPSCFGFKGMLMPIRFLFYCSAAFTVQGQLGRWGNVLEIGAGLGNLGFISYYQDAESYTVIDLPSVAIMSAFFMGKVCGSEKVWLSGESENKNSFARFYASTELEDVRHNSYHLIFNSDSLPEMPGPVRDGYINLIADCLSPDGIFLSINHESDRAGQGSVLESVRHNGRLRLAARYPFMMRDGYIEEIYRRK